MDGTTIDVTGTSAGYHIELGTSVTAFTLTDVTFNGTPGTDKIHVLATTGTVTITLSGTTSLVVSDVTSEGAAIVITVPSSNISVTGMPTAGANIRLQITNETAKTASSWQAATAYSAGDKVLRSTGVGSENVAGLYFVATTAGTSGGSEPTWSTSVGGTTSDNTVTWTTYGILFYDDDPSSASYAATYINGEEFSTGDTYGIRFAELNGSTSFKIYDTLGLTSSTGFSVLVSEEADSVYAENAVDGSSASVTNKFTADYANDQIDLDTNSDFAATEVFAYYCYELTTSQGMYQFWDGFTAIDVANYRINTASANIFFDETAGFVKQTDSPRIFRDDDIRPAIDPTTGGNGIEINWRNPVYGFDTTTGVTSNVNVKYVNDEKITGTGTKDDPWRPV